MAEKPHHHPGRKGEYPMELLHMDVAGPFEEGIDGSRYWLTIVDDYTGWIEVILILRRREFAIESLRFFLDPNERAERKCRRTMENVGAQRYGLPEATAAAAGGSTMTWQGKEPTSHIRHSFVPASRRHVSMAPPEQAPSKSSNDISQAHSQSSNEARNDPVRVTMTRKGERRSHRVTMTRSQMLKREI
ncbi:hypothetical protein PSPO01_16063 [Paraphaeosphaeria sporulosa]